METQADPSRNKNMLSMKPMKDNGTPVSEVFYNSRWIPREQYLIELRRMVE